MSREKAVILLGEPTEETGDRITWQGTLNERLNTTDFFEATVRNGKLYSWTAGER